MIAFKLFYAINTTLCYIPGMLLRIAPFKQVMTKRQKRTLTLLYIILLLINMVILGAVQLFLIDDITTSSWLVKVDYNIYGTIVVLLNCLIIKGHWREHFFTHGFVITSTFLPLQISTFIGMNMTFLEPLEAYLAGTFIFVVLLLVAYYPLERILTKTVAPFLSINCVDYWRRVWFIPMMMFYGMFFTLPINENVSDIHHLLSRVLISFATMFFCYVVAADHKLLLEKQALDNQLSMSKVHYASLQANVDGARRIRHDHKHLIASIRHYIETDDKEGLKGFCDSIEVRDNKEVPIPYTGNVAVDGIIYHYMLRARAENIDFEYQGRIKSDGIADIDLSVLLGNALDNAFAAAATKDNERRVLLVAQSEEGQLSIIVNNTFDGHIISNEEKIFSRRRGGEEEGIGLSSMKSVCNSYGGIFETKWDEGMFTVLIILPLA